MDVNPPQPKISMHNDEVIAYLADAMYLKKTTTSISGGPLEKAIYSAAFAIIHAHQMLTKLGVNLKWTNYYSSPTRYIPGSRAEPGSRSNKLYCEALTGVADPVTT